MMAVVNLSLAAAKEWLQGILSFRFLRISRFGGDTVPSVVGVADLRSSRL